MRLPWRAARSADRSSRAPGATPPRADAAAPRRERPGGEQEPGREVTSSATRPPTLLGAVRLRQRNERQLEHAPGSRRHAARGAAAEAGDPDDGTAGLDDRHPSAIPARHLRLDQERLEPPLGAAEGDEALAAPAGADEEWQCELVGVERHAARLAGNRV